MERQKLSIFKAKDAPFIEETDAMTLGPMNEAIQAGAGRLHAAGGTGEGSGSDTRLLFRKEGDGPCSLVHVWLKPNKPLPRHSHDSDCTYYIVNGEVIMGSHVLGPGDGFFVPAGDPYGYRVGPEGAEVLEFRPAASFDLQLHEERPEAWDRLAQAAEENGEAWRTTALPPSWR